MNETERKYLNIKRVVSRIAPEVRTLFVGSKFKNAVRTSDDQAAVGSSWKEYWQIFTMEDFPTKCPFCGEPLAEIDIDGCHIKIMGTVLGSWSVKKYIIPGHHACNMQLGDEFISKIQVEAVEAIEKKQ